MLRSVGNAESNLIKSSEVANGVEKHTVKHKFPVTRRKEDVQNAILLNYNGTLVQAAG